MIKISNQSRFANVTIEACLERLQKLYKITKDDEMENSELYKFLGLSIKSGYANRIIAAMKYYGFIVKKGTKFIISDVSKKYIKNKTLTLKEFQYCLSSVPIYNLILHDYSFDEIVNNKFDMKSYLIEKTDYTDLQVEAFLKIHDQNLRFSLKKGVEVKTTNNNNSNKESELVLNESLEEKDKMELNATNKLGHILLPLEDGKNIEFIYPEDLTNEQIKTVIEFSIEYIKRIMISKYTNKL